MYFSDAKIGDNVYSYIYGWGKVRANNGETVIYPLLVKFHKSIGEKTYTLRGKQHLTDVNQTLFWDEVDGIIPPPKPPPQLEVDTKVIVWNKRSNTKLNRHFSHFDKDRIVTFIDGTTSFSNNGSFNSWDCYEVV